MASKAPYPFKWENLENDSGGLTKFKLARSTPGGHMLRRGIVRIHEDIYNMEVRDDDIWLLAHPKTGSTMMKEIIYNISHGVKSDKPKKYYEWSCLVEMTGIQPQMVIEMLKDGNIPEEYMHHMENFDERTLEYYSDSVAWMGKMESPRLMKSHVPMELLPPDLQNKAKVVYLARNPKSVCASLFHHMTNKPGFVKNFEGSYDDFVKLFLQGKLGRGEFFKHLKGGLDNRGNPNFKFIWYEDVRKDMAKVIRELAAFLEKDISEEDVALLQENMKKENFRERYLETKIGQTPKAAQEFFEGFVRKDKSENPTMSPELGAKFDSWIEENVKNLGLEEFKEILMGQTAAK